MLKICALWAVLIPASAQVYKWVDANGTTHYGQRAPAGVKAEEIGQHLATPAPPEKKVTPPDWKAKEIEFQRRRIEAEQAEASREKQQAANRTACTQARDYLAQISAARRIYRLNDKGERVYESDDEREAAIARQKAIVALHCR